MMSCFVFSKYKNWIYEGGGEEKGELKKKGEGGGKTGGEEETETKKVGGQKGGEGRK